MALSWQQGPLAERRVGWFLAPEPVPDRLLWAEPLRRRMRAVLGDVAVVDTDDVIALHEPGRYPVAYFPRAAVAPGVLTPTSHTTRHPDLGPVSWYAVEAGGRSAPRGAWGFADLPHWAGVLAGRVAFAWRAMDAFYEEDERVIGHAADAYHRVDVRQSSRHLRVLLDGHVVADTRAPRVLYETGFAPRWYVPPADVDPAILVPAERRTYCPYKEFAAWYHAEVPGARAEHAAWSYPTPYPESARIGGYLSFYPQLVDVDIDGVALAEEQGQSVVAHGSDRDLRPAAES